VNKKAGEDEELLEILHDWNFWKNELDTYGGYRKEVQVKERRKIKGSG